MPKGIPFLTEIQKQEIIKRVTDNSERPVDLAREFMLIQNNFNLLKTKANQHQTVLELAKLKREIAVSRNSLYYKPKLPVKDLILKQ